MQEQTGSIPVVNGHRVWYRIVGGGSEHEEAPLLVLHGGPGCPHDYLENLAALASEKRRVIFYDQLGCGRLGLPAYTPLWPPERFSREIGVLRPALALVRCDFFCPSDGASPGVRTPRLPPP